MSRRRVVVTGLGLISPVGNTVADGWANLVAGKSGIAEITKFDTTNFSTRFAGEVKGFKVEDYMPAKLGFYAQWLARWLACCLPGEEKLQDEMLRQISIRARSYRGFVY